MTIAGWRTKLKKRSVPRGAHARTTSMRIGPLLVSRRTTNRSGARRFISGESGCSSASSIDGCAADCSRHGTSAAPASIRS